MEKLILTIVIATYFHLDPLDWRSWVICWGILGGLAQLF